MMCARDLSDRQSHANPPDSIMPVIFSGLPPIRVSSGAEVPVDGARPSPSRIVSAWMSMTRSSHMRALVEAGFMAIHTPLVEAYTWLLSVVPM